MSLPSKSCISSVASKGNSEYCFKARSLWFRTCVLVGLVTLDEINKYLLSGILAHDTKLSLFLAQQSRALNALLSLAFTGRKKDASRDFSSALSTSASWPTRQAPGVRDAQTLFFWLLSVSWGWSSLASVEFNYCLYNLTIFQRVI